MKEIYITAHAGAERTKPNTMESLEKMINLPCQMVEVDVRKCDGELVLSHDPLKQQESVTGFVKLSEALEFICKNKKGVNLDLKEEILPEVFEELKNCLVSKKVVFSGSIRIADIEMHPEIAGKVILNYENLYEMCLPTQRRYHKLTEWSKDFMKFARQLPYADVLLFGDEISK